MGAVTAERAQSRKLPKIKEGVPVYREQRTKYSWFYRHTHRRLGMVTQTPTGPEGFVRAWLTGEKKPTVVKLTPNETGSQPEAVREDMIDRVRLIGLEPIADPRTTRVTIRRKSRPWHTKIGAITEKESLRLEGTHLVKRIKIIGKLKDLSLVEKPEVTEAVVYTNGEHTDKLSQKIAAAKEKVRVVHAKQYRVRVKDPVLVKDHNNLARVGEIGLRTHTWQEGQRGYEWLVLVPFYKAGNSLPQRLPDSNITVKIKENGRRVKRRRRTLRKAKKELISRIRTAHEASKIRY